MRNHTRSALPLLIVLSACTSESPSPAGPAVDPSALTSSIDACRVGSFAHDDHCRAHQNGRMAWSQLVATNTGVGIFSAKADGSDQRQLTTPSNPDFNDFLPDWSPDGSMIVFERDYGGNDQGIAQLFRVNADGSGLIQLNDCTGECLGNTEPSFSPDGSKILFGKAVGPVTPENNGTDLGIWVMNADGSDPVRITPRQSPMRWEPHFARWSPDGRKLAFARLNITAEPVGRFAIFVMDADGRDARRITPWALDAFEPDWSPDGTLILFSSHIDPTPSDPGELYTVHPDGSGLHKIRPQGLGPPPDYYALLAGYGKFSPDGRSIVFQHQDPETSIIYKMNLDGREVVELTFQTVSEEPAWGTHP